MYDMGAHHPCVGTARAPSKLYNLKHILPANMEAVGFVASAAQIATYAVKIISVIDQVRVQIKDGPSYLQERREHLNILQAIIEKIEKNSDLHTYKVSSYLGIVQHRIQRLQTQLERSLKKLNGPFLVKHLLALSSLHAEKQIRESFTGLQGDCSTLTLYLSAYPVSQRRSDSAMAPKTQMQTRQVRRHDE